MLTFEGSAFRASVSCHDRYVFTSFRYVLLRNKISGGGDQIYSDRIYVDGPLQAWAKDLKPSRRAKTPLTPELSRELDEWYFKNYVSWYTSSPFCEASASIPSLQLWDDHE